jgi:hypothetical protein
MEGHTALVHTAAASSLGIMLNKVCIKEGVALVNIVRKQEQVDLLTKLGAKFLLILRVRVLRKICTRRLMPRVQRRSRGQST